MLTLIGELLLICMGIGIGLFFRVQIRAKVKAGLSWFKKTADDIDRQL